jgi:hypothetical protein
MYASRKMDAINTLTRFRQNIEGGNVKPALKKRTIGRKRSMGYSKPDAPLRGMGMDMAKTYARTMRIYRILRGWKVMMPARPHHSSKLNTKALFDIHENGALIVTHKAVIRIPSRPALATAYRQTLRDVGKHDPLIQDAISEYLATGGTGKIQAILNEAERLEREAGEVDGGKPD